MTPERRFALFRALSALEILCAVGTVVSLQGQHGSQNPAAMVLAGILVNVYVAGFVIAVLGVLAKPRQPLMVASLAVHALIAVAMLFAPKIDDWISERQISEYRRVSDNQEHAEQLIASQQVEAALKVIASNDELASQMLAEVAACPKVGVPNAKLVRTLLDRDPQVRFTAAGARCSVEAVTALLALRLPQPTFDPDSLDQVVDPAVAEVLVKHGASVNKRGAGGTTPLMFKRSLAITEWLLAHGADAKAIDDEGLGVLHSRHTLCADPAELPAIFERLLQAGAPVDLQASDSAETPLMSFFKERRGAPIAVARILVQHGADPLAKNHGGEYPALYVLERGPPDSDAERIAALREWWPIKFNSTDGSSLLLQLLESERTRDLVLELIKQGADPSLPSRDGTRPIDFVRTLAGPGAEDLLHEMERTKR